MNITPIIAPAPLECHRCLSIGIPEPTIMQGEQCMEIETEADICFACMDCWDRLLDEIEQNP